MLTSAVFGDVGSSLYPGKRFQILALCFCCMFHGVSNIFAYICYCTDLLCLEVFFVVGTEFCALCIFGGYKTLAVFCGLCLWIMEDIDITEGREALYSPDAPLLLARLPHQSQLLTFKRMGHGWDPKGKKPCGNAWAADIKSSPTSQSLVTTVSGNLLHLPSGEVRVVASRGCQNRIACFRKAKSCNEMRPIQNQTNNATIHFVHSVSF